MNFVRARLGITALLLALGLVGGASAQVAALLMWKHGGACPADVKPLEEVGRCLQIEVNPFSMDTDALELELPSGSSIVVTRERTDRRGIGRFVWSGSIDSRKGAATFSVRDGIVGGGFSLADGRRYRIRHSGQAGHFLEELNSRSFPLHEPAPPPVPLSPPSVTWKVKSEVCSHEDGLTVDVLVAYTPAAGASAGGAAVLKNEVQLAETETNWALWASNTGASIRVLEVLSVDYLEPEEGTAGHVIDDMRAPQVQLKQLHEWRDALGADVVVLIAEIRGSGGLTAFTFQPYMVDHPEQMAHRAFAVVSRLSLMIPQSYVFAHEIGHVFGAQHETEAKYKPFKFSRALVRPPTSPVLSGCDKGWMTLTSTSNSCAGCITIPRWSSADPALKYCNELTGGPTRDNAETIRRTAATVARVRCSKDQ